MKPLAFGSVCSGIEAASVAWHPLGWRAAWLAEIEKFPAAVLAHHYPDTPNLGDMTQIARQVLSGSVSAPDVLVGGTPCQAFSVAGMRDGLADPRGELTIKFVELADAIDHVRTGRGEEPSIIVWENVPGVLSDKGNAFGCFLGALAGEECELQPAGKRWADAGCVYGPQRAIAWRVLDAQYFGLAQRRRRVFVVASARRGFDPAAVLFEREGMRRDTAPRRGEGQDVAGTLASRTTGGGFPGTDEACSGYVQPVDDRATGFRMVAFGEYSGDGSASTMKARDYKDATDLVVSPTLSVALRGREGGATAELGDDVAGCLRASSGGGDKPHVMTPVAFVQNSRDEVGLMGGDGQIVGALAAETGAKQQCYVSRPESAVRRLTPVECERLQGFPDDHTKIPWRNKPAEDCPDGPRYKALGNSMAVPCMRWIGLRIKIYLEA